MTDEELESLLMLMGERIDVAFTAISALTSETLELTSAFREYVALNATPEPTTLTLVDNEPIH